MCRVSAPVSLYSSAGCQQRTGFHLGCVRQEDRVPGWTLLVSAFTALSFQQQTVYQALRKQLKRCVCKQILIAHCLLCKAGPLLLAPALQAGRHPMENPRVTTCMSYGSVALLCPTSNLSAEEPLSATSQQSQALRVVFILVEMSCLTVAVTL